MDVKTITKQNENTVTKSDDQHVTSSSSAGGPVHGVVSATNANARAVEVVTSSSKGRFVDWLFSLFPSSSPSSALSSSAPSQLSKSKSSAQHAQGPAYSLDQLAQHLHLFDYAMLAAARSEDTHANELVFDFFDLMRKRNVLPSANTFETLLIACSALTASSPKNKVQCLTCAACHAFFVSDTAAKRSRCWRACTIKTSNRPRFTYLHCWNASPLADRPICNVVSHDEFTSCSFIGRHRHCYQKQSRG